MTVESALLASDTRHAAHERIKPLKGRLERGVLRAIAEHGPVSCDRLERLLSMSHQSCSARVHDLAQSGRIVDSNVRERTKAGRLAICWKIRAEQLSLL